MGWPTFEDGTVDWDKVFNDPETGLIAMVNNADTPKKLRACYHATINGLFFRESDDKIRKKYLYDLDKFFTIEQDERHMAGLQRQITMLFTRIMQNRIERARTFVRMKEKGNERRMPEDKPLEALEGLGDE
ncbi:MAG: hypothetical protein QGI13_15720 [Rhodospirillales bacterium]|jgi:hypothetical protein|nr:hypothetical protein [Rhodospirillales bacterium]